MRPYSFERAELFHSELFTTQQVLPLHDHRRKSHKQGTLGAFPQKGITHWDIATRISLVGGDSSNGPLSGNPNLR